MNNKRNPTTFSFPSDKEIVMTRVFDAPRELVYDAYTNPHFIPKWWGPRDLTTTVDQMEVRPGGTWRFVHRDPEGEEYAFHGVYLEVELYQRVVQTFNYEGMPDHESLETIIFEDRGVAKTRVTSTTQFKTVEDRDGMYQSGMEEGSTESMERLDELLEELVEGCEGEI